MTPIPTRRRETPPAPAQASGPVPDCADCARAASCGGHPLDDSNSDDNFDIGVYQFDGVNEGTYDTSRLGLERLIRSYDMAISARNVDETVAILRAICL